MSTSAEQSASFEEGPIPEDFFRLARALRRAEGFALYFATCVVPTYRHTLVRQLKAAVQREILEVDLAATDDPHDRIAAVANSNEPNTIIFISGLERLLPASDPRLAEATLGALNWGRSGLQRLECPLVFWTPPFVVTSIAEGAPDFFDWNSGRYEFKAPEALVESVLDLEHGISDPLANLDVEEKRERIELLETLEDEYRGGTPTERRVRSNTARQLSVLHGNLGEYHKAKLAGARALKLYQDAGDRAGEAATWSELATIDVHEGQYACAREKFQKALEITQAISERAGEAASWYHLATIDVHEDQYARAREKFQRALEINQTIGHAAGEAATWHNLASIDLKQGRYAAAREEFQKALEIKQSTGNRAGEAATWHQLATIDLYEGRFAPAREKLQKALEVKHAIGDRAGEAATLNQLGAVAYELGRGDSAAPLMAISLSIFQEIGSPDAQRVLANLSGVCSELGYDQARVDKLVAEAGEAYKGDGGRSLIEAAFAGLDDGGGDGQDQARRRPLPEADGETV